MYQKQSNSISKVIGAVFILFGFCMLCIGFPMLFESNKDQFAIGLMLVFLLSGILMISGGFQSIKRANLKDKAIIDYEQQIQILLNTNNSKKQNLIKQDTDLVEKGVNQSEIITNTETYIDKKFKEVYKPDIIATWNYTKTEWNLMTKEETKRRLKEGIWVTLGIGLIGGWVIHTSRDASFITAFIFSLGIGIFLSLLKTLIANNLFKSAKNNTILITSNALIINNQFKTIKDIDIELEYVKLIKLDENSFIEFSLKWLTRRGATNDQIRILVPKANEIEIEKVLSYFK